MSGTVEAMVNGLGIYAGASVGVNTAVTADVDAAVAAATGLRLMGYSCKETAGIPAAATFRVMRGATVGAGTAVANVNLAASSSQTQWFGDGGIACQNGISLDFLTGQFDVCLFYKVVL